MGKRARFGVVTKPKRDKPKKRPGRHKKNRRKNPVAKILKFFTPTVIKDKKKYTRKEKHGRKIFERI